jgi:hypothetical protein
MSSSGCWAPAAASAASGFGGSFGGGKIRHIWQRPYLDGPDPPIVTGLSGAKPEEYDKRDESRTGAGGISLCFAVQAAAVFPWRVPMDIIVTVPGP